MSQDKKLYPVQSSSRSAGSRNLAAAALVELTPLGNSPPQRQPPSPPQPQPPALSEIEPLRKRKQAGRVARPAPSKRKKLDPKAAGPPPAKAAEPRPAQPTGAQPTAAAEQQRFVYRVYREVGGMQRLVLARSNIAELPANTSWTWYSSADAANAAYVRREQAERKRRMQLLKASKSYASAAADPSWDGLWYFGDSRIGVADPFTLLYGLQLDLAEDQRRLLEQFEPLQHGWSPAPRTPPQPQPLAPPRGSPTKPAAPSRQSAPEPAPAPTASSLEDWFEPLPGGRLLLENDKLLVYAYAADDDALLAEPGEAEALPPQKLFYDPDNPAWRGVDAVLALSSTPLASGRNPVRLLPRLADAQLLLRRQRCGKRGPHWDTQFVLRNQKLLPAQQLALSPPPLPIHYKSNRKLAKPKDFHKHDPVACPR